MFLTKEKVRFLSALCLLIIISCLFYLLLYLPQLDKIAVQQERLVEKEESIRRAESFHEAHADTEEYERTMLANMQAADARLPDAMQQGDFLSMLQAAALKQGILLRGVVPGQEEQKTGYKAKPVQLTIEGNYFQLLDFLQELESEARFVRLDSMVIDKAARDGRGLLCHLQISIYAAGQADGQEGT